MICNCGPVCRLVGGLSSVGCNHSSVRMPSCLLCSACLPAWLASCSPGWQPLSSPWLSCARPPANRRHMNVGGVQLALGGVIPEVAVVERKMQLHKLELAKMVRSSQANLLPDTAREYIAQGGSAYVFGAGESHAGSRAPKVLRDGDRLGTSRSVLCE
jgi:hypothetical protein